MPDPATLRDQVKQLAPLLVLIANPGRLGALLAIGASAHSAASWGRRRAP